jgi:transposase
MGTAAAFLAYVGDGSRFSKPAEVAHYVGLTPYMDCSGDSKWYGHITRMGCRAIRSVILNSVWSLTRSGNGGRLQRKYDELSGRIGKKKSAVAIARRMVTVMWLLVRRREFYQDIPREQLEKKFRRYNVHYEGWGAKIA